MIYVIFMSVCFKLFDVSQNFSKTVTPFLNHVWSVWAKPICFKQIKRMNVRSSCCKFFAVYILK